MTITFHVFVLFSYKKELPELVTVRNTFLSKNVETKSNSLLQDRLNKCNRLIDVLRKENLQQKSEVGFYIYFMYIQQIPVKLLN